MNIDGAERMFKNIMADIRQKNPQSAIVHYEETGMSSCQKNTPIRKPMLLKLSVTVEST